MNVWKETVFNTPTIKGLLLKWAESRRDRNLDPDLELETSDYFTPDSIAKVNKLKSIPKLANMENHIFYLKKN